MSNNNNDNTQVLEPVTTEETAVVEVAKAATASVTKTKKELKKERKEIKKHKKAVRNEAKQHSAKATKVQKFFLTVLTLIVIGSMLFCSYTAITVTMNFAKAPAANNSTNVVQDSQSNNDTSSSTNSTPSVNNTPSTDTSTNTDSTPSTDANADANTDTNTNDAPSADTNTNDAPAADSNNSSGNAVTGDLSTKEGVVEYYKAAHAKVFAEAKSVTRTYDNPTNYNGVVEVGNNSTISGIASSLMGTFMKPNTEAVVFEGASEIKSHFPPANENGCAGLTADMISEYKCEEKDGNYIITLTLNSTEENPDDGTMAQHMVEVVGLDVITEAAGSVVTISDFKNLYVGSTVVATIEKDTGKMIALDVNNPSYMCFGKAKALIITVENCKLGLHYEQKWTVQW